LLNARFSGLAADGAKLALWNLTQVGYRYLAYNKPCNVTPHRLMSQWLLGDARRLVAFIHDEFVIEVAETCNLTHEANIIEQIMIESMQRVTYNVPVVCETYAADCWSPNAQRIVDQDGNLLVHRVRDSVRQAGQEKTLEIVLDSATIKAATNQNKEASD
jgi:hypothetical protein